MKVGCHVSILGGIRNGVKEAQVLKNTAFALWLSNSRSYRRKQLTPADIEGFKEECASGNYNPKTDILPHASFLINLGNPDKEKWQRSYDLFLSELKECEELGIGLYNIHPGSAMGKPKQQAIKRIADAINLAHAETKFVKVVLENMAGNVDRVVGSEFEDLRKLISYVKNKDRVGVCVDTCHTFAAGHDISTETGFNEFWDFFDAEIGMKYLSAIHVNDSCWPLGSRRDQHARIGTGFIGPQCFRLLMNKKELEEVPMVLETDDFEEEVPQLFWFKNKTAEEVEKECVGLIESGAAMRRANQHKTDEKNARLEGKRSRKRA